ncbi:MAG: DUF6732 family protein [Pseudomonadota bacterium]
MRILGVLVLWPGAAAAHVGHLGEVAGHSHWIALGAIGLAGAIAVWAGLKGKRAADDDKAAEDDGEETAA